MMVARAPFNTPTRRAPDAAAGHQQTPAHCALGGRGRLHTCAREGEKADDVAEFDTRFLFGFLLSGHLLLVVLLQRARAARVALRVLHAKGAAERLEEGGDDVRRAEGIGGGGEGDEADGEAQDAHANHRCRSLPIDERCARRDQERVHRSEGGDVFPELR